MDLLLEEPWLILNAGQFLSLFWREEVDVELTDPLGSEEPRGSVGAGDMWKEL